MSSRYTHTYTYTHTHTYTCTNTYVHVYTDLEEKNIYTCGRSKPELASTHTCMFWIDAFVRSVPSEGKNKVYRTNYIYKVGIISTYKKNNFIYIKTDISTCIQ